MLITTRWEVWDMNDLFSKTWQWKLQPNEVMCVSDIWSTYMYVEVLCIICTCIKWRVENLPLVSLVSDTCSPSSQNLCLAAQQVWSQLVILVIAV